MQKSIAVVVTYNRKQLLSECIQALRNQTKPLDKILVINNGSTDATEQWLHEENDIELINQSNCGSAGGFNKGIEWAFVNGYTWIWCMDDDGYPKNDAFENLLKGEDDKELRLLNCAVINKEDKKSFVWKTQHYKTLSDVDCKLIKGIGHPFNGTLVHRKIVERVGVPQKRFFLWGDETEYYYRITRKNAIPVYTVGDSVHYHPASAFSIKKDWDYASAWKMYYYVRNRFFVHKIKFGNKLLATINYLCFIIAFAGIILMFQKTDKIKKLWFMIWPVADAFTNRFDVSPPLILNRLKNGMNYSFLIWIHLFVKIFQERVFSNSFKVEGSQTMIDS